MEAIINVGSNEDPEDEEPATADTATISATGFLKNNERSCVSLTAILWGVGAAAFGAVAGVAAFGAVPFGGATGALLRAEFGTGVFGAGAGCFEVAA